MIQTEQLNKPLWDGLMLMTFVLTPNTGRQEVLSRYNQLATRYESDPFRRELESYGKLMPGLVRTYGEDLQLLRCELQASLDLFPLTQSVVRDLDAAFPLERVEQLVNAWKRYKESFS